MPDKFKVKLSESAMNEFLKLDGSIKKLVAKQLKALEDNPFKGEMLGNKAGIDLTGYYKLYVSKKQIRIVYQVIGNELIVFVVGIGKRENMEVYKKTLSQINQI